MPAPFVLVSPCPNTLWPLTAKTTVGASGCPIAQALNFTHSTSRQFQSVVAACHLDTATLLLIHRAC